jgi:glycosyltransferase involved in cell wall biosynthesis
MKYSDGVHMKIVHLEAEFIPQLGYQVNLFAKIMSKLSHEVIIVSTSLNERCVRKHQRSYLLPDQIQQDYFYSKEHGVKIIRVPCYGIINDRHLWSINTFKTLRELNPDIIYVHDNDTLISMLYLLTELRKNGCPIIMDTHMIEFSSINRFAPAFRIFYKKFITPIIKRNEIKILRTVNDPYILNHFNIPEKLAPIVSFGSDTSHFVRDDIKRNIIRDELGICHTERVFIYTGKLSVDKNGLLLSEALFRSFDKFPFQPTFVIISSPTDNYSKDVLVRLKASQNKIVIIPFVPYKDLADWFNVADVAIIHYASSLTFFDYLSSGLPVICSNIEVNKNRAKIDSVELFESGSSHILRSSISRFLNMDLDELNRLSKLARSHIISNYDYEKIVFDLLKLMEREVIFRKQNPYF